MTKLSELIQAPESEVEGPVEKYQVAIPSWTGPYDLLLQVIDDQDLNLFDLNISLLLQHYLEYMDCLEVLNLDEAGEFLIVAATLAQIKSKMLLPEEEKEEQEEEVDPRAELVRYLIEYQQYKKVASELSERPLLGRDVFVKGSKEVFSGLEADGSGKLFQLVKGFQKALLRAKHQQPFEIEREEVSVSDRFQQIFRELKETKECSFENFLPENSSKVFLIASFLAVLEMVRMKKVRILQRDESGPLFIVLNEGASEEDIVHSEFDEKSVDEEERSAGEEGVA